MTKEKFEQIRKELGYTQIQMAHFIGYKGNNANQSYQKLIKGAIKLSMDNLMNLISKLDKLNLNWFFSNGGEMWKKEENEAEELKHYRKVIKNVLLDNEKLEGLLEEQNGELKQIIKELKLLKKELK